MSERIADRGQNGYGRKIVLAGRPANWRRTRGRTEGGRVVDTTGGTDVQVLRPHQVMGGHEHVPGADRKTISNLAIDFQIPLLRVRNWALVVDPA